MRSVNEKKLTNGKGEADFTTSNIGEISFLLWHEIYPDDLTFTPFLGCIYRDKTINFGELMSSYWTGEKIPVCELAECVCIANRILSKKKIDSSWYVEMWNAIEDIRRDYVFPIYLYDTNEDKIRI